MARISLRRKQFTNISWSRQTGLDRPKRTKDKRQRNTEKGLQTQRTATNDTYNRRSMKRESHNQLRYPTGDPRTKPAQRKHHHRGCLPSGGKPSTRQQYKAAKHPPEKEKSGIASTHIRYGGKASAQEKRWQSIHLSRPERRSIHSEQAPVARRRPRIRPVAKHPPQDGKASAT